jgi:hypothetical protein
VFSAKNLCKSQSAKVLVQIRGLLFFIGDATHHIHVFPEGRGEFIVPTACSFAIFGCFAITCFQ